MPVGAAIINPWPGSMMVNVNMVGEGCQQNLLSLAGVMNTLDVTVTLGNHPLQIMLLDPLTMLPLPGFPQLLPGAPGATVSFQFMFIGPPAGNVLVQITALAGAFPFPGFFMVDYVAVSIQNVVHNTVCWNEDYRFGFNGQEKDNEISGVGNSMTAEFWQYDSRLGRRWNVDPVRKPDVSAYAAFSNKPVIMIDPEGNTDYYNSKGKWIGSDGIDNGEKKIVLSKQTAKIIKRATRKGQNISMNEQVYRDIINLPTKSEVQAMNDIWKDSDKGIKPGESNIGHEEGFVSGGGQIDRATPGKEFNVDNGQGDAEYTELSDLLLYRAMWGPKIELVVHTHPSLIGTYSYSSASPSGQVGIDGGIGDFNNAKEVEKRVNNRNIEFAVIGREAEPNISGDVIFDFKPTVTFYDSEGTKGKIKLKSLEKAVDRARRTETP